MRIVRLFLLLLTLVSAAVHAQAPRPDGTVAREVLVQLKQGIDITAVAPQYRLTVLDQFGTRPIWRTRIGSGDTVNGVVAALRADTRVQFAEPHTVQQTPEARRFIVWVIGGSDSEWGSQWAGDTLNLAQAHAVTTGEGVRVAVIDTGIDTGHPSLAPSLARNAQGQLLGRDFVNDDNDPREEGNSSQAGYGHGTHVAGLLRLAAPGAKIMPVRALDPNGRGIAWVIGEALMYAVDPDGNPATNDGARVINLSLGTTRPTDFLERVVQLATCDLDDDDDGADFSDPRFAADKARCDNNGGAVVISAAGNGASSTEKLYPAAEQVEGALSVAATTETLRIASFSNRGRWIQLGAPGDGLVSTFPLSSWATWSGTSMSAPLVSGVAALLRAANPDWKPVDVTKRIQDRSVRTCGNNWLRQVDAAGAVLDFVPPDPAC